MLMEQIIRVVLLYEHHFPLPCNPHSILAISLLLHLHPNILSLTIARFSHESIFQEMDRWIDLHNQNSRFFSIQNKRSFPIAFASGANGPFQTRQQMVVVVVEVKSLDVSRINVVMLCLMRCRVITCAAPCPAGKFGDPGFHQVGD